MKLITSVLLFSAVAMELATAGQTCAKTTGRVLCNGQVPDNPKGIILELVDSDDFEWQRTTVGCHDTGVARPDEDGYFELLGCAGDTLSMSDYYIRVTNFQCGSRTCNMYNKAKEIRNAPQNGYKHSQCADEKGSKIPFYSKEAGTIDLSKADRNC